MREWKSRNEIWAILLLNHHLMLWIRFRKELAMLAPFTLRICYVCSWFSMLSQLVGTNYNLKYKHNNFSLLLNFAFNILYSKFCLSLFFTHPQPLFIFLQFERDSDRNTLKLSNEVLFSETKLNHVKSKTMRVYSFVKKTNIELPSSMTIS